MRTLFVQARAPLAQRAIGALLGGDVGLRHVNQLVVHDDVHALVAGNRLERKVQRRDLHRQRITRDDRRPGVSGVGEIRQQQRDLVRRLEAEQSFLEGEGIQKRSWGMRHEKRFGGIDVDQAQAGRLERRQLREGDAREADEQREKKGKRKNPFSLVPLQRQFPRSSDWNRWLMSADENPGARSAASTFASASRWRKPASDSARRKASRRSDWTSAASENAPARASLRSESTKA